MRRNNGTAKLTLCAMFTALSFVFMYFGGVTGLLDMSAAVLAGLVTVMTVSECGMKMTACSVAACAVLCLALIADKTVGVLYLFTSGVYPLVKPFADRRKRTVAWSIKLAAAVAVILIYIGAIFLFLPSEAGKFIIPVGLVFGTLCFVLYDILLTRFEIIYFARLRRMFLKK